MIALQALPIRLTSWFSKFEPPMAYCKREFAEIKKAELKLFFYANTTFQFNRQNF